MKRLPLETLALALAGSLAGSLAGCGRSDYRIAIPPCTVGEMCGGSSPKNEPKKEEKKEEPKEEPWAKPCSETTLSKGRYKAVIWSRDGEKFYDVIYVVNLFQEEHRIGGGVVSKFCELHFNKDIIAYDGQCNDSVDNLSFWRSFGGQERTVYREELEKWGLADFFDRKFKETKLYVCAENLIKPKEIEGVERIVEKYK